MDRNRTKDRQSFAVELTDAELDCVSGGDSTTPTVSSNLEKTWSDTTMGVIGNFK